MPISAPPNPYKHHRFPAEIISHGVWWYFHFCLSYRDVEELLFARGVIVTYEPIRKQYLKGLTYVPRVIITDKLKRYGAAKREILPDMELRQHRSLNNRAEHSHQPTRQRERRLQRFKSPGHAQRFLSAYGPIASHFRPRRPLLSAPEYRQEMTQRFQLWREMTGTAMGA